MFHFPVLVLASERKSDSDCVVVGGAGATVGWRAGRERGRGLRGVGVGVRVA